MTTVITSTPLATTTSQELYTQAKGLYDTQIKPIFKVCHQIGIIKESAKLQTKIYGSSETPLRDLPNLQERSARFQKFMAEIKSATVLAETTLATITAIEAEIGKRIVNPSTLQDLAERQPSAYQATLQEHQTCQKYLAEIKAWHAEFKIAIDQIHERTPDAERPVKQLLALLAGKIEALQPKEAEKEPAASNQLKGPGFLSVLASRIWQASPSQPGEAIQQDKDPKAQIFEDDDLLKEEDLPTEEELASSAPAEKTKSDSPPPPAQDAVGKSREGGQEGVASGDDLIK